MNRVFLILFNLFLCLAYQGYALAQCVAPDCTKIIDNGPDTGRKVIAVMGDGFAAADQDAYNTAVNTLITNGVFGNDFFRENHNAFNVYRINLNSVDSGVSQKRYNDNTKIDDPSDDTIIADQTVNRNTALSYVYTGMWSRCWLEESSQTATLRQNALTRFVPNADFWVVILNETGFGGCGGGGGQIVTRAVGWDVMSHEFGHGIGGLMDEYTRNRNYTGGAINTRNCSTVTDRATIFWNRFINPSTALPTTFNSSTMNSNRTVGLFTGCGTFSSGIYRPVDNCRMNGNTPNFCPVCQTLMKKDLYPSLQHNFAKSYAGDFNNDGREDILIHNGQDLAIYRKSSSGGHSLSQVWAANNVVPAGSGGLTWQPAPNDQYVVADFTGDKKADVFVFNGTDWVTSYLGLLSSDGTGLKCVARYDGAISGFWTMSSGDKLFVGDYNNDGKKDLVLFNGSTLKLGLLHSTGSALSGKKRYDGSIPGWSMNTNDQYFVGDFDGDAKSDLYVFNGTDWGTKYLAMLKSSGSAFSGVKLFADSLPGWSMNTNDKLFVGDFNGDKKSDLYIFNGTDWGFAYLLMAKSTGSDLAHVKRYDNSSSTLNIPGWQLASGDNLYISDANKDGKADLFVYNPRVNWSTERLGTLISSSTALSGTFSSDWVGGWNLNPGDKILAVNYEGGSGKADIYIRNDQWFGLIRRTSSGLVMDRIYQKWIYTALHDSTPWSDSLP
jgi:hypothetical protein